MARTIEKPPLGVRPAWVAAWQRIGELAEGIVRQYESNNGDVDLVQLWSKEIDVQCKIINVAKKQQRYLRQKR